MNEPGGWTIETLYAHFTTLLVGARELQAERDRRYSEVAVEREKAIKIKEQADRDALDLARQIQTYKDTKANELREQINSERGLYVTKTDLRGAIEKLEAQLAPLVSYVASQQGKSTGISATWGWLVGIVGFILMLIALGTFVFVTVGKSSSSAQPIYIPAPPGTTLPANPPANVPR